MLNKAEELLMIWEQAGGYYSCPVDAEGRPTGRLVGYAGKYQDDDGVERQKVGLKYYNFGAVEEKGPILDQFALAVVKVLYRLDREVNDYEIDWVCGAPMGGLALGQRVAAGLGVTYIYPEKQVIAVATAESREVSKLVFGRHTPGPGTRGVVIEDVVNNLSTASELDAIICEAGAKMIAIGCALNRSSKRTADVGSGTIPLQEAIYEPTAQYRQDDPLVATAIAEGRVVWKPKNDWDALMAEMRATV